MSAIPLGQRSLPKLAILIVFLAGLAACGGAEARKERYLEKAEALAAEENFEKAQLELRNALQIDPDYVAARVLMGRVAEKLGDPRAAAQMYRGAFELDETNVEARTGLARLYAFGGLPDEALKLAEAGLAVSPEDPGLLTVRAAARARLNDLDGARADAEHALRVDPLDEDAIALLAGIHSVQGRDDEALALVQERIGDLPDSVDLRLVLAQLYAKAGRRDEVERLYREVIALRPAMMAHRYRLAEFLLADDDIDAAEEVLREAIRANPDDLEPKRALVRLLASRRSFEAGEEEMLSLVAAEPDDVELRLALGDYYSTGVKREQAEGVYREVISMDGLDASGLAARNRLAATAVAEKRFDVAERLIAEVLEANPQDNDALVLRADIALAKGDAAAAVGDLRAVLRDQPTSIPVQRGLAQAYLQSNDVALAEETLKKAIETSPGNSQLRVDLAQVLVRNGQEDRALKVLQDAVAETPANLAAQEQLFLYYFARKNLEDARQIADAVKAARPDLPLGDYLAGLVSGAEGKTEAAMASFEAALKLQPDSAEPLTELVGLLVSQGRAEDAIARLGSVGKAQPQNAVARNLLGELLTSRKRYPEAVAVFDEAIALAPAWWVPYRGKALAQLGARDAGAAVQTMQRGLEASDGAISLGVDLAALQERIGQPDEAIRTYETMLERSPSNDLLANNLAMLIATYRSDGDSLERARQLSDRFKDSNVAAYLNTAGWVSYKLGRFDEAVPLLKRASDQQPDAALMRYHLAMAQIKAGQVDDARRNLEAVLESGARFPGMDDARATLDQLKSS